MLDRARTRAPEAEFVTLDLTGSLEPIADGYDRVVMSFILHELDPAARERLLRLAVDRLTDQGSVGILEWDLPTSAMRRRVWRGVVRTIEPAVAHDVLAGGIDRALNGAELRPSTVIPAAGGRASIVIAVDNRG